MTQRGRGGQGSATVLLLLAVLLGGAASVAVGRAGSIAAARARADLVAESVAASVASDLVRGLAPEAAIRRGRVLAGSTQVVVDRLTVAEGVVRVRVRRHGEAGVATAVLEP